MSPHNDWSFLTKEWLESLYAELGNWNEVAEVLGIHKQGLIDLRRRVGLEMWQYPEPKNRTKRQNRLDPWKDRILEMAQIGMNCGEIAREIGDDDEQVRKFLAYHGVQRQGPGARKGEKNPMWNGGQVFDKDGYVLVRKPDHPFCDRHGYVRLHRLAMEEKLGRYLAPQEVVHHIDGDRQNNDPENLELFDCNGDHIRREWEDPNWRQHQSDVRRGARARRGIREGLETYAPGL